MTATNGQKESAGANGKLAAAALETGPFGLIDIETGNTVGSFSSEQEALFAVAAIARQYGSGSNAVLSLSLFREDVPPEQGFIADGAALVRRALAAASAPAVAERPAAVRQPR